MTVWLDSEFEQVSYLPIYVHELRRYNTVQRIVDKELWRECLQELWELFFDVLTTLTVTLPSTNCKKAFVDILRKDAEQLDIKDGEVIHQIMTEELSCAAIHSLQVCSCIHIVCLMLNLIE